MKSLVFAMILAGAVFAEPTNNFEVKEIDAATMIGLESANRAVDADLKAFQSAQQRLDTSRANRDRLLADAKRPFKEFEGQCLWGGGAAISSPKQFRRVEIRGKYALITNGSESCMGAWTTTLPISNSGTFLSQ